jgi:DNA invertase Pin-like site-specific DNA recombinase
MLIAYYRVSTERQGISGLGIEAQKATRQYVARSGGLLIHEYERSGHI